MQHLTDEAIVIKKEEKSYIKGFKGVPYSAFTGVVRNFVIYSELSYNSLYY